MTYNAANRSKAVLEIIGLRLYHYRLACRESPQAAARAVGISYRRLLLIEQGLIDYPYTLPIKLCDHYRVDDRSLWGDLPFC